MTNSIYLKQLIDKNVGPLSDIRIDFPFFDNGDPKPIILVGENGTGKSTILSNIVDALFEMAGKVYNNVKQYNEGSGYHYFKTISPSEIHTGASFLYSFILFTSEKDLKYIFKSGNISVKDFKEQIGDKTINISWNNNENKKDIIADKGTISDIWSNNVLCYFGPDRYEKPAWMGNKYYQTENFLHPTVKNNLDGILKNDIIIQDVTSYNLQWLLDVIADSRADIEGDPHSMRLAPTTNADDVFLLKQARNDLETILSKILGDDVYFQLNYRNSGGSRFRIAKKRGNIIVCPTLDSLSTGQIALFNMFATIVRYADNNDINKSFHLNEITGIVIIDEIELHLHTKLQKEVLPELLKLFPKIQFVITSHSPLFLLGMRDVLGEDGFEVYEMPYAEKISVERFSEFLRAYNYIKETEQYQEEIRRIINRIPAGEKPIIITEGSTDWKHMKAAYNVLSEKDEYKDLFYGLEFDFLEYEPEGSTYKAKHYINMGNKTLVQICKNMAKIPHNVKHIFISDRDGPKINEEMSNDGEEYKKWGNNIYSFILPIPNHRKSTPNISIEHYYTDDEIKTEWIDTQNDNIARRLFIGNEFDERGIACNIDRVCGNKNKCGKDSIAIIEGSSDERVTCLRNNEGINYALSKSKFAKMILSKQAPFDKFNFESFVDLFKIIKDIINDSQE